MEEGDSLRCRRRLSLRKLEDAGQPAFLDEPSDAAFHQAGGCRAGHSVERIPTLRHSYTTLLRQGGNDVKVVQDLLRHASYKLTMDADDDAVSSEKREAQSGVIRLISNRTQTRTQAEDGRMASA